MSTFLDLIQKRRSIYALGKNISVSQEKIIETIQTCLKYAPSAFNSQTARLLVLFNYPYQELWELTKETLEKIVPAPQFSATEKKLNSFTTGIGTILFFEEQKTIKKLQEQFPTYADKFPIWSNQSSAIIQYGIWLALAELNIGANLQHYNPLIDQKVKEAFNVPDSWLLNAQMNFGSIEKPADEKTFLPLEERIKIIK